jgi:hypothetical protein
VRSNPATVKCGSFYIGVFAFLQHSRKEELCFVVVFVNADRGKQICAVKIDGKISLDTLARRFPILVKT